VTAVAYSSSGDLFASGHQNGTLQLWEGTVSSWGVGRGMWIVLAGHVDSVWGGMWIVFGGHVDSVGGACG
jgi:hypothetical protein